MFRGGRLQHNGGPSNRGDKSMSLFEGRIHLRENTDNARCS